MVDDEILFEKGPWQIEKTFEPADDVVDLFADTIWGSPGKTLMQQLGIRDRIPKLKNPCFLLLRRAGELKAGLTVCPRTISFHGQAVNSFYIRFFSFVERFRNKKPNKKNSSADNNSFINPNSVLKQVALKFLSSPEAILAPDKLTEKAIYYAYVESENIRSLNQVRSFGFEQIGRFNTVSFSRFSPKKNGAVSRVEEKDKAFVLAKVQERYKGYGLFFSEHLFYEDNYFVIKKDGKIVAGAQASSVNWVLHNLPGFSGTITLKIMPYVPFISRLFNPANFRFAVFEGIFALPGFEEELFTLFESILAEFKLNSALMWMDEQSELTHFFQNSGQLGLLNQLNTGTPVNVMARFINFSPEEVEHLKKQTVYVSALDIT